MQSKITLSTPLLPLSSKGEYQRHEVRKVLLALAVIIAEQNNLKPEQVATYAGPGGTIEVFRKPKVLLGTITSARHYAQNEQFKVDITFTPKPPAILDQHGNAMGQ